MSQPPPLQSVYFRMPARVKLALDRLVAELRATGRLMFKGRKVSQESMVGALLLWAEELGAEELEGELARHLPRLEAILRGDPDPGAAPRPVEPHRFDRHLGASEIRLPPLPPAGGSGVGEGPQRDDERPKRKRRPPRSE